MGHAPPIEPFRFTRIEAAVLTPMRKTVPHSDRFTQSRIYLDVVDLPLRSTFATIGRPHHVTPDRTGIGLRTNSDLSDRPRRLTTA